jgi:hypothetical protein
MGPSRSISWTQDECSDSIESSRCDDNADQGSSSHPSGSGNDLESTHQSVLDELEAVQAMARVETQQLRLWRTIVLIVMVSTGAIVSTITYRYLSQREHRQALDSVRVAPNVACLRVCFMFDSLTYPCDLHLHFLSL